MTVSSKHYILLFFRLVVLLAMKRARDQGCAPQANGVEHKDDDDDDDSADAVDAAAAGEDIASGVNGRWTNTLLAGSLCVFHQLSPPSLLFPPAPTVAFHPLDPCTIFFRTPSA